MTFAGGQGELKGEIFRIGHMGAATPLDMVTTLGRRSRWEWPRSALPVTFGQGRRAGVGGMEVVALKVLVSDAIAEEGMAYLEQAPGIEVTDGSFVEPYRSCSSGSGSTTASSCAARPGSTPI